MADGYAFLITEKGEFERNYEVYPARFGNIYSTRQLLQLFSRAYGLFLPQDETWVRPDGALVDPFRPQIEPVGFPSIDALVADRRDHLAAVRRMFELCDVLIFTLGLTEVWRSVVDGAVVPLAPGVVAESTTAAEYEFANLEVSDMVGDLCTTIDKLRTVNTSARVVLTVSPVPLVATYENRHVLLSTIYSKSALRVVAEMVCRRVQGVSYFPSYEIITGHHNRYAYFEPDLRSVSSEGVAQVMRLFKRHYLRDDVQTQTGLPKEHGPDTTAQEMAIEQRLRQAKDILCDEEELDPRN